MKISNLIFFIKNKLQNKYDIFHSKYHFSQREVFKILDKVKFNLPDVNLKNFNKQILENSGLGFDKPFYVEQFRNLNFNYAKSLFLSQKIFPFNLIIFYNEKDKIEKFKLFLKDAKFFSLQDMSKDLKEQIYNLNINLKTKQKHSQEKENFEEVNKQKMNKLSFKEYELISENKFVILSQTYLDGNYYFFKNKIKNTQNNYFLIKKILFFNDFNYLLINKIKNYFEIIELNSLKKSYVLCSEKIKNVSVVRANIPNCFVLEIAIQTNKNFSLYVGENFVDINNEGLEFEVKEKLREKFSLKINSSNFKLNYFFNTYLPNQIILENIKGKILTKNFLVRSNSPEEILNEFQSKK